MTAWMAPIAAVGHAVVTGTLQTLMTLVALLTLHEEQPLWFLVANLVVMVPAAWLGGRLKPRGPKRARPAFHGSVV